MSSMTRSNVIYDSFRRHLPGVKSYLNDSKVPLEQPEEGI